MTVADEGVAEREKSSPAPVNETGLIAGLLLLFTVSVPVRVPLAVGLNDTLI